MRPLKLIDSNIHPVLDKNRLIGLVGRVFANGPETWVQSQVASYEDFKNGTWHRLD